MKKIYNIELYTFLAHVCISIAIISKIKTHTQQKLKIFL